MKNVAREATNGVIYGESGEIVKNSLRVVCPHCGEIGLFHDRGGSVNIWTVGAIERRECTKCRIISSGKRGKNNGAGRRGCRGPTRAPPIMRTAGF